MPIPSRRAFLTTTTAAAAATLLPCPTSAQLQPNPVPTPAAPGGKAAPAQGAAGAGLSPTFKNLTDPFLPSGRYTARLLASGVRDGTGVSLSADHVFNFFFLSADMHWSLYEPLRRGLAALLARGGGIRDDIVVAGVSYVGQPEFCVAPSQSSRRATRYGVPPSVDQPPLELEYSAKIGAPLYVRTTPSNGKIGSRSVLLISRARGAIIAATCG